MLNNFISTVITKVFFITIINLRINFDYNDSNEEPNSCFGGMAVPL